MLLLLIFSVNQTHKKPQKTSAENKTYRLVSLGHRCFLLVQCSFCRNHRENGAALHKDTERTVAPNENMRIRIIQPKRGGRGEHWWSRTPVSTLPFEEGACVRAGAEAWLGHAVGHNTRL